MPTEVAGCFDLLQESLLGGLINWSSDTIKVMLCTSTYTPNKATHQYKSSVTNEVASGGGYTTGGITLSSKTIGTTSSVTKLAASNVSWTTSTITARYAIVYKSTGTDSTSPLIRYGDFGSSVSSAGGNFDINWNAAGVWTQTTAAAA